MAEKVDEVKKEEAQPQTKEKKEKDQKGEQKDTKKQAQQKDHKKLISIVRLAGKDVNGSLNLERAISRVRGVGPSLSHSLVFAIETKLNIPKSTTLGALSEDQIESIEGLMKEPTKFGVPKFLLNRQKDTETGKDIHLVSNELIFATRQDISRDITLRLWRGHRHQYGQKVRGQRTRSTGRTGTTVGVIKKAELAKSAPAAAGAAAAPAAKKEEKKPAA
jgi:small subunit ribosomal protein S13